MLANDTPAAGFPAGPYLFGAFLILCSLACAMPVAPVCRAVAAGCTILGAVVAGFAILQAARGAPWTGVLEATEVCFVASVIAAGTAFYTFTGRLPSWVGIIVHRRTKPSPEGSSSGEARTPEFEPGNAPVR